MEDAYEDTQDRHVASAAAVTQEPCSSGSGRKC